MFETSSFHSQWGQDRYLYDHFFHHRGGTFFEVGAHDGVTLSNTLFFERELGWRGALVEMQPWFFPRMSELRPGSLCINSGIGPGPMELLFLDAGDRSGLLRYFAHSDVEYLENFYRDRDPKPKFNLHWVNVRPLQDILDQASIRHIDYFSLDVEGAEMQILTMIDFSRVTVDLFTIEDNSPVDQWKSYRDYLAPHGYKCIGGLGVDAIFVHERLLARLAAARGADYLTKIREKLLPLPPS